MIEVSIETIASLTQYYDQPLRCFMFGDFQLVPTVEEFEQILGCPLGGRKPYLFFWVLSPHGEDSQGGQNFGTRIGLSKTKQRWGGQNTEEALGGESESFGGSR